MKDMILSDKRKRIIVYILLFISNLAFVIFFLVYGPDQAMDLSIRDVGRFFTIVSALIIFAFITSRLPKLRSLGDSSLYEITYLLIMGLVSLTVSYFNGIVNNSIVLEPFISMFNVLAIVLIVMICSTRLKSVKAMIRGDYERKELIVCLIVFLILGVLSTFLTKNLGHSTANVRSMTIMIAGLFGGPIIGIPTALLAAACRLFIGGPTAWPCAISTVICGVIAGAMHVWNGNRFLRTAQSAYLMFLFMGFEMLMILLMVPNSIGIPIVMEIYAPMTFVAVIGIILFKLVIAEIRRKDDDVPIDVETEIKNLKADLKDYEEKIKTLEDEIAKNSDEKE